VFLFLSGPWDRAGDLGSVQPPFALAILRDNLEIMKLDICEDMDFCQHKSQPEIFVLSATLLASCPIAHRTLQPLPTRLASRVIQLYLPYWEQGVLLMQGQVDTTKLAS
jgi:hypothetical protein